MRAPRARVEAPRDLTLPEPGSTTARRILSLSLGRLRGDLADMLRATSASRQGDTRSLLALVTEAHGARPGALFSALRRVEVGVLVRCLRTPERGTAAERAHWLGELDRRLRAALSRTERKGAEGADEEPVGPPIAGGIALALTDDNPLALVEAHPDKAGNALDLGGRAPADWCAALGGALALIAEHLPELRAEMDLFVQRVVPVGWSDERHLSATYQEAIGTLYLSLHPSRMVLAEAWLHEFSHTKLNALFELDGVLENAWSPLYRSPVRPDPRPLHGVLLAVHAFLPVARLYETMLERGDPLAAAPGFRRRYAEVRALNREGASVVLGHGRPTEVGKGLLEEIRRWDAYYAAVSR